MGNEADLIKRAIEKCSLDAVKCKNWPPLEAKLDILSVEWEGGIPMRREDSPIKKPHWEDSFFNSFKEEDDKDILHFKTGSERPAAYTLKDRPKLNVRIRFEFKGGTPPNSFTLSGTLGALKMQSKAYKAGAKSAEMTVPLEITNPPAALQHVEGDAHFKIKWDECIEMDFAKKPRLEVFFLYDNPTKFPFFKDGVWAEALRFAFKKIGVVGKTDPVDISAAVTRYCHTGHGMKYDTVKGDSGFNAYPFGADKFKLKDYISKKGIVNCYDQAAAVQCLCGGLGVKTGWLFVGPTKFGFIKLTHLVGIGPCNNPFFNLPDPKVSRNPVWMPGDPKERTEFSNHAFVQINYDPSAHDKTYIRDACVGPHISNENLLQYLTASIDVDYEINLLWKGWITTPAAIIDDRVRDTAIGIGTTGVQW
jgi:hypothetical protein